MIETTNIHSEKHSDGSSEPNPFDPQASPPEASEETASETSEKPCIRISPGNLHVSAAEAEHVLANTRRYYISAGALVRVVDDDARGVSTEQVNEHTLKTVLSEMIDWERQAREGGWVRCDPHHAVVQALLHGQDRPHLQSLSGLARQPYFGPKGPITQPGFDISKNKGRRADGLRLEPGDSAERRSWRVVAD